jgi:hypothetical protein
MIMKFPVEKEIVSDMIEVFIMALLLPITLLGWFCGAIAGTFVQFYMGAYNLYKDN